MYMEIEKEVIRRDLTILALNNLIDDYNYALEDIEELPQEVKDFMQMCIDESKVYLSELITNIDKQLDRPVWK